MFQRLACGHSVSSWLEGGCQVPPWCTSNGPQYTLARMVATTGRRLSCFSKWCLAGSGLTSVRPNVPKQVVGDNRDLSEATLATPQLFVCEEKPLLPLVRCQGTATVRASLPAGCLRSTPVQQQYKKKHRMLVGASHGGAVAGGPCLHPPAARRGIFVCQAAGRKRSAGPVVTRTGRAHTARPPTVPSAASTAPRPRSPPPSRKAQCGHGNSSPRPGICCIASLTRVRLVCLAPCCFAFGAHRSDNRR